MKSLPQDRPHLVERAVEAFGATFALDRSSPSRPPSPPAAQATPPRPLPSRAAREAAGAPAPAAPGVDLDTLKRAGLAVAIAGVSRSRLSEEFNILQQQVVRTVRATPNAEGRFGHAVLVTSARPNEGKTFSSLNLSASMAAGGTSRVLLVDADGKRSGSISELLKLTDAPGLRSLAEGGAAPIASLLVPTAQERLAVLPYGAVAAGDPEMPAGSMVAVAIQRLAAALPDHVIIVDSPPCLSTSDPHSLAAVAGMVLMVVEAERTQRNEVEAALDMVDACPNLRLMLNRTRLTENDTFGAYGYGYGYGGYGTTNAG